MARDPVLFRDLRLAALATTALIQLLGCSAHRPPPAERPPGVAQQRRDVSGIDDASVGHAAREVGAVGSSVEKSRTGATPGVSSVILKVIDEAGVPQQFVDVHLEGVEGTTYASTELVEAENGEITFVALPAGSYQAQAFAEGYTSDIIRRIVVGPNTTQSHVIEMHPTAAVASMQVIVGGVVPDSEEDTVSSSMTGEYLSKVPLQNGSGDVVAASPGVMRVGSSESETLSIGCGAGNAIAYRVDGRPTNDAVDGGLTIQVPAAAIQSFKLITVGASARYGERATGIVEFVQAPEAARLGASAPAESREGYRHEKPRPFRKTADEPLSTFGIDVDTASYSNVRRFLEGGELPPPGAVRVEEMLNYFRYDDPEPDASWPFAISTEVAGCPWAPSNRLLRIGIKTRALDDRESPPLSLVFLVDTSGSMQSEDKLPLVVAGLRLLAQQLDAKDRIAIVTYAGSAGLELATTSGADQGAVLHALDNLGAGGSTNGAEGILLAYDVAEKQRIEGGANRVILCTDGDFNVGVSSDDELVRLIEKEREKGVFLTVLGFGTGNYQDAKMEQLADHGNGNFGYVDSLDEARKLLVTEVGATLVTVAKDVKIQVELNPKEVKSWRLVGYENRLLAHEDFDDDRKDAGDVGAGHSVTALYEIVPAREAKPAGREVALRYQEEPALTKAAASGELLTLRLRFKLPDGEKSELIETSVIDEGQSLASATDDFRFAAAVAAFGEILRGSEEVGRFSLDDVGPLARGGVWNDPGGVRGGFLDLVAKAQALQPPKRAAR